MDLNNLLAKTEQEIDSLKANIALTNTGEVDQLDKARSSEELFVNQALLAKKQNYLAQVIKALDKERKGHFGICEDCEEDIDNSRLVINPAYECCASCQSIREHKRKSSQANWQQTRAANYE